MGRIKVSMTMEMDEGFGLDSALKVVHEAMDDAGLAVQSMSADLLEGD